MPEGLKKGMDELKRKKKCHTPGGEKVIASSTCCVKSFLNKKKKPVALYTRVQVFPLAQWLLKLVQYYKSIERRLAGYFVRFTQFVTNENKQIHYCVQRLRETTYVYSPSTIRQSEFEGFVTAILCVLPVLQFVWIRRSWRTIHRHQGKYSFHCDQTDAINAVGYKFFPVLF